ncbi:unnamed protein product [Ectocarpus sp. CCAP 1310/34]|nr:unnamed protein product [Ectocarpus sp. CCAP 1310/34]
MGERRVVLEVQARDGRRLNIETALPGGECTPTTTLKLTLPALAPSEAASPAASFLRINRDPANLLLGYLAPESWLEVEQACRAGRVAVASSRCWTDKRVGDGKGKAVYVRQRRALHRVSRAFQDLRRFARSPASVFNPGATLADTMNAEQRTGVLFPDEARASFLLFDGQARSGWLRSEGVIGGFELLSLAESVDLMLEEACFRGESGPPPEFVPLANRRNSNEWLAAEVGGGRVCVIKPLSRPKVVASSWSHYLRVQ